MVCGLGWSTSRWQHLHKACRLSAQKWFPHCFLTISLALLKGMPSSQGDEVALGFGSVVQTVLCGFSREETASELGLPHLGWYSPGIGLVGD